MKEEKQALKLALNKDANDMIVSWERVPRMEDRGRAKIETPEGGSSKHWLSIFPS